MKDLGIITIHKIRNYGSVLQAYALQNTCEKLGYKVKIIDYTFPNVFQVKNKYHTAVDAQPCEPKWIKLLFWKALIRQHRGIDAFVKERLHLTERQYLSPEELEKNPPWFDVYMTGSDQVWSPRHTNGDPSFMLHFAPNEGRRVSYAASIGSNQIPEELRSSYGELLRRYNSIAVRETSGKEVIRELTGMESQVVLDPSLLMTRDEWNSIAMSKRLIKKPYILCYFLNYSFNAFPYVDNLAKDIQMQTGYEIVRVARPPHKLKLSNTKYFIGASPSEFLSLVRDAELVLTTSFHGTAFAVNFGRPVFTVVKDRASEDSRQIDLMKSLGLDDNVLTIKDEFPGFEKAIYDQKNEQQRLASLRRESLDYLRKALQYE